MASIKLSKIKEINGGCANDFKLDVQYYVIYKEYALEKYELIKDNYYKKYRLYYREHYDYITNEYGCKYPKYDGTYNIYLNVNYSRKEDKMIITNGLGKDYLLGSAFTRKTIKTLQEYTKIDLKEFE